MDQLKEILKQAIKYRFWIAVGLSALLPIIAYAAGSGRVKQKAAEETAKIKAANADVNQYTSGVVPNHQYKPIVEVKKDELVKDVNASWRKLYARQAPLLTWPELVADRFPVWERKWPENVDPGVVQQAIIEYVESYPKAVTEVYQKFHPFDLFEGTGVVSAPTEEVLLRPFPLTIDTPPEMGQVWAAQERLWTQRTIVEVIAQVNQEAKDWDHATIKQINLLEVGNAAAQDQKSIAKGETLTEAPAIGNPANPPPPPPEAGGEPGAEGFVTPTMMTANPQTVYYIKNDSSQFKILPFELSVLIEQNRIQDLLIALENSPMAVQVMEFEMSKPSTRVVKPVKGQNMNYMEYSGVPSFMPGMDGRMPTSMPGFFGGMTRMSMMPSMPGGRVAAGKDVRTLDRKSKREQDEKAAASAVPMTLHDPYYNIVEVTVYGQARFYNPPPPEPAPEPSSSVAESAETPEGTPPAAEAPMPAADAPKAEAPPAEAPAPAPAPAAPAAPIPTGEAPKAEPGATPPT